MPSSLRFKITLFAIVAALFPLFLLWEALAAHSPALRIICWSVALLWVVVGACSLYLFCPQWGSGLWHLRRRHRGEKIVLLTFDDGPDEPWTGRVLDILKREDVSATFFVLGGKARAHPELLQRIAAEGHDIGNHTMSHRTVVGLGRDAIARQVDEASAAIRGAVGTQPTLFRAPHGFRSPLLRGVLARRGLRSVPWTKGIWDTDGADAAELLRRFHRRIAEFEILLLHDGTDASAPTAGRQPTIDALPSIISEYRARGYRFLRASDLLTSQLLAGTR